MMKKHVMKTELRVRRWAWRGVQEGEGRAPRTESRYLVQWDARTQDGGKA